MSDAVYIALIAAIIVPLMGTVVTAMGVAAKYFQDKAIANSQAERDRAAAVLAKEVATKVEETKKDLATQNANVDKKLDIIHKEVNSQLTAALAKVVELQADIIVLKGLLLVRMQGGPDAEVATAATEEAQIKIQSKVEEITAQAAELTSQAASVSSQAADVSAKAAEIAKDSSKD